jgi:hypothetical protein
MLASALSACGGGGSGYGSGSSTPAAGSSTPAAGSSTPAAGSSTPAPVVSFSQPAQAMTVHYGQALQLAWTSTNATSCSATSSSASGGSFTGSQAMSGNATVVPTGPGSYTYTLQCTGTGGMVSASTPAVTVQPSILGSLAKSAQITTIGSTVDPVNGDQNPYGLTIAPVTSGLITAGDLIVCNFNDGPTNTQGLGTTIVGLHPTAGSKPYRIAQSSDLQGCNALTMLADDSISVAAWMANLNPLVSPAGSVQQPFASDTFGGPWGEATATTTSGSVDLYVSTTAGGAINASGSIRRISLDGDAQVSFTDIATGFCSSGAPGAIFGPAGLTYDPSNDTLYVVDTSSNSVIAFAGVSSIMANGITVAGQCGTGASTPTPAPTFSGPSASSARVIAHGAPLSAPLSAALLSDGDLVIGNADINVTSASPTTNLLIEVSPVLPGGFVDQPLQLDSGTPGALFGITAKADAQGNQVIYFNDDNASAVLELSAGTATTPPAPYSAGR